MIRYYSAAGLLNFSVDCRRSPADRIIQGAVGAWDAELRGLETGKPVTPVDLEFRVGACPWPKGAHLVLDDDYRVAGASLWGAMRYGRFRWTLGVERAGRPWRIRIQAGALTRPWLAELVILPLVWFALNRKGCPVVHGAAVARDGRVCLLAGPSGTGKTTLALRLAQRGFGLVSEHFTVLGSEGVRPLVTPLHLMDYNMTPGVWDGLRSTQRLAYRFRQLVRLTTGRRLAVKILPADILGLRKAAEGRLRACLFLLPSTTRRMRVEQVDAATMAGCLLYNQKMENMPLERFVLAAAYLFPDADWDRYWSDYRFHLERLLDGVPALYQVEVPAKLDAGTVSTVKGLVSDIIHGGA